MGESVTADNGQIAIQLPSDKRGQWDANFKVFLTPRAAVEHALFVPENGLDPARNQITVKSGGDAGNVPFDWILVGLK